MTTCEICCRELRKSELEEHTRRRHGLNATINAAWDEEREGAAFGGSSPAKQQTTNELDDEELVFSGFYFDEATVSKLRIFF